MSEGEQAFIGLDETSVYRFCYALIMCNCEMENVGYRRASIPSLKAGGAPDGTMLVPSGAFLLFFAPGGTSSVPSGAVGIWQKAGRKRGSFFEGDVGCLNNVAS